MRKTIVAILAIFGFMALANLAMATTITYTLTGAGPYRYDYTVSNDTLPNPITDFLVYFPDVTNPDAPYYVLTSGGAPTGWNYSLTQPSTINLGGMYESPDPLAPLGSSIPVGGMLSGFFVEFDYTGTAPLGSQSFEVYDANFNLLDSGRTVLYQPGQPAIPEPSTWLLLGTGLLGVIAARLRKS